MARWTSILGWITAVITVLVVRRCLMLIALWRRTVKMGHPIPLARLFSMATRRIPPATVSAAFVSAKQHDVSVSLDQLEQHFLDGGHPARVVEAVIVARQRGIDIPFRVMANRDRQGLDLGDTAEPESR